LTPQLLGIHYGVLELAFRVYVILDHWETFRQPEWIEPFCTGGKLALAVEDSQLHGAVHWHGAERTNTHFCMNATKVIP